MMKKIREKKFMINYLRKSKFIKEKLLLIKGFTVCDRVKGRAHGC